MSRKVVVICFPGRRLRWSRPFSGTGCDQSLSKLAKLTSSQLGEPLPGRFDRIFSIDGDGIYVCCVCVMIELCWKKPGPYAHLRSKQFSKDEGWNIRSFIYLFINFFRRIDPHSLIFLLVNTYLWWIFYFNHWNKSILKRLLFSRSQKI
jgi:hypothetical protein